MGAMDLRQDALTRLEAFVLVGHLRGDIAGRDRLVADLLIVRDAEDGGALVALADALSYVATVGVSMLAAVTNTSIDVTPAGLIEPGDRLLPPPAQVPWEEAKGLVEATPAGPRAAA